MKIRPLVAELFHGDRRRAGRADMTKDTVAFRNFANAPNNFTENTTNTLFKKKQVALIMLIIALQFDVSTSFNM